MDIKLQLPYKIVSYLRRLKIEYDRYESGIFSNTVSSAKVFIRKPPTTYENFGVYSYGYDIVFFLPASIMEEIDLEKEISYRKEILEDLEKCKDVKEEFFENVFFACENESDEEYRQAVSLTDRPQIDPETLDIWKSGRVRLFISHRDKHKKKARELADALEAYGISSFVAHETIGAMTEWQAEIMKGLETMEIMLTFITDDFHESVWVNQEIGFALARNIPILSLKLQSTDPKGFVSGEQALKGNFERPSDSAPKIYRILEKKLNDKKRLQSALITAFIESPSWDDTRNQFDRLNKVVESLSEKEVERIIDGFKKNDQLHRATYLKNKYNRLKNFLERTTGKKYVIKGNTISYEGEPEFLE